MEKRSKGDGRPAVVLTNNLVPREVTVDARLKSPPDFALVAQVTGRVGWSDLGHPLERGEDGTFRALARGQLFTETERQLVPVVERGTSVLDPKGLGADRRFFGTACSVGVSVTQPPQSFWSLQQGRLVTASHSRPGLLNCPP